MERWLVGIRVVSFVHWERYIVVAVVNKLEWGIFLADEESRKYSFAVTK